MERLDPSEAPPQIDEMEARLFLAKPLGVLRLAAAFPIPAAENLSDLRVWRTAPRNPGILA